MENQKTNINTSYENSRNHKRDYSFEFCGYSFKQVSSSETGRIFYQLFESSFYEVLGLAKDSDEYKEIIRKSIDLDQKFDDKILKLLVFEGDVPVATISAYLDHLGFQPCELKERIDLSPLRKYGNVMELGRLTIQEPYRLKPKLGLGLFKFIVEVALTNDVDILIESAFKSKISMFERIGLESFEMEDSFDTIYNLPKKALFYNFAAGLFAYHNPDARLNGFNLSNYCKMVYSISHPELRNLGYQSLLNRNKLRPASQRTYSIRFNDLLK